MTDQFKVALARGIAQSVITGALTFFTTWQTTDDIKILVTTTAISVLSPLALRFGAEGYIDSVRAAKRGESQAVQ